MVSMGCRFSTCVPNPFPLLRSAVLVFGLWLLASPVAVAGSGYLAELTERARQLRLAERIEWVNLVHYKPNLMTGGVHSLADAPRFFNAPNGKTDPQAELEATLASFFSDLPETDSQQNPQCQFIARYRWLKRELGFDAARLPERGCPRYEQWRASLNPHEITLVFPAAYLNNPASMYGHTLLRIDATDQDERTRLLAYAINYAANTDERSGLVFAVKGLLGGYPGQFSIAPYYLKVQEYNDIENRDIWEYRLDFTPQEIDRLLEHAWELGPIYFDYYFFDENCSYHLLALFEVARPTLALTDQFRWWAIPSDTVRAVTEQPGLLKEAIYRPARATQIRHRLQYLRPAERSLAKDLAERRARVEDARLTQLAPSTQAAVLELAHEYSAYLRVTGRAGDVVENARQARELLLARSRVDAQAELPPMTPPAVRPEQGHETARVALGAGRDDARNFVELQVRPAYHDLLDPQPGYVRGAQIEFFDVRARHYSADDSVRLESFYPLRIVSLSPRDEYFRTVSWKVDVGWERIRLANGARPLVFDAAVAPGLTWDLDSAERGLLFAFLEGTLQVDGAFQDGYSVGLGPALGVLWDFGDAWRVDVTARAQRFGGGEEHTLYDAALAARYSLTAQTALRLEAGHQRDFDHGANRAGIFWMAYF
jgi:hypothetical protein